ncbi:25020_t:CDS:1 [Dentiscutata erythropus]|uniref:25020_t:CDS:1 n=1 Tax=Dentiscutata erythropus TaxID=1348616 RepID=A0A9N9A9S5_9GLOM|nr:25020_t:CDS:1 [Dentiscutata erythropus]
MSKDLMKPFFHDKKKDDINGFLFDYSRYTKSKNWDNEMRCEMIVMHMPDETKAWVRELIKGCNNNWNKLEKGIVRVINTEGNEKLKINCLRNIKQGKKKMIREYTSRFEAYTDTVKDKIKEDEKQDWYLDGMRKLYGSRVKNFCFDNFNKAKVTAF